MQIELERQAQKIPFNVATNAFNQAQRLVVAAEQQMLAVVQSQIIPRKGMVAFSSSGGELDRGPVVLLFLLPNGVWNVHAARPPAELFRTFEYRDVDATRG